MDGNGFHSEAYLKFYDKHGKPRPKHEEHGEDSRQNPISKQLRRLETANWRLEGNKLICDTDMGPLVQYIPPGYICEGTDDDGKPILTKPRLQ